MKRDDTKKNFTALSGNDLATVHLHYLSFSCFIALVTFSEICGVMRYRSVINALFHFFCSENRNFFIKEQGLRIGDGSLTFCCTLIQYIQELTTKIVKIFYISKLTNIKALSTI